MVHKFVDHILFLNNCAQNQCGYPLGCSIIIKNCVLFLLIRYFVVSLHRNKENALGKETSKTKDDCDNNKY